jgi:hypothetical protein
MPSKRALAALCAAPALLLGCGGSGDPPPTGNISAKVHAYAPSRPSASARTELPARPQRPPPPLPSEAELNRDANPPAKPVPTGPELSLEEVRAIATRQARFALVGGSTPATMSVTRGKLGTAQEVLSSEGSARKPTRRFSSPDRRFPVFVVVMHGEFHSTGSLPRGEKASRYRVLTLVIDAHTGFVTIEDLGPNTPDVEKIGPTTELRSAKG